MQPRAHTLEAERWAPIFPSAKLHFLGLLCQSADHLDNLVAPDTTTAFISASPAYHHRHDGTSCHHHRDHSQQHETAEKCEWHRSTSPGREKDGDARGRGREGIKHLLNTDQSSCPKLVESDVRIRTASPTTTQRLAPEPPKIALNSDSESVLMSG